MPTNRKRRPRNRKATCSPALEAKLFDRPKPKDANPFEWLNDPRRDQWEEHRARVLAKWTKTKPGTRPSTWWRFDAPEGRQRLGGVGSSSSPNFFLGVPGFWWSPDISEIINMQVIDPADPPRFESQAAFLRRHGLLDDDELERTDPADFEPETIFSIMDRAGIILCGYEDVMGD